MVYKPASLLLLPYLAFGASFKPFKNSQCTDPIEISSGVGNGTIKNNELAVDTSITDWESPNGPAGHWYDKMMYKGAGQSGSNNGTGANNVYWKIHGRDEGWKTMTPLPGEIAFVAQREGCYYSSLNNFDGLITSYCCGEGDCAGVNMGATLFVKRAIQEEPREAASNPAGAARTIRRRRAAAAVPPPTETDVLNDLKELDDFSWAPADETNSEKFSDYRPEDQSQGDALDKRAFWDTITDWFTPDEPEAPSVPEAPENPPEDEEPEEPEPPVETPEPEPAPSQAATPEYKIVDGTQKKTGTTLGQQSIVTTPQSCDTGPASCAHTVSVTYSASTALSHTEGSSWTLTGGVSVGLNTGIDFIVKGQLDTTLTGSVAKAWTEDTGTTITTGWSNSTSQTLAQQVGTQAALSFTPFYECWRGDADCGEDENGDKIIVEEIDFCQPIMRGEGGMISGQYSVVYL